MPEPITVSRSPGMCDEWNHHHRSEAPLQRADRNFAELLQELRVLLTSVHILFGFLLALAFSARFGALDGFQHAVFVVTLFAAALSSALLVTPVAAHRVLFRRGRKRELVTAGHLAASAGVAGLAVTLISALLLVLDLTAGRVVAVAAVGVLVGTVVGLWLVVPLRMRR
ncbi:MAG: DUF6328 family protein [Pseudonocardia sp.]